MFSSSATDVVIDVEGYVVSPSLPASGAGLYVPLPSPSRICDTRLGDPSGLSGPAAQCNAAPLAASSVRSVGVAGSFGVPAGATAVVANVTVVNPTGAGYLTAYPDGAVRPTASDGNYGAGQTVPSRVVVALGADGRFDLYSSGATDVVVDISGYDTAAGGAGSEDVAAATPVRICDTRTGNPSALSGAAIQCTGRPIAAGKTLTVAAAGKFGIPANATAVIANITAVSPTATSYQTVYPTGAPPTTSDLNPAAGETEANLVIATVTPGGTFTVFNSAGTTDVVVDVTGWYVAAPRSAPLSITTTSLPTGTAGTTYSPTLLTATGGTSPYRWSATGLPAGLTLSPTGVLAGTPSVSGTTDATIVISDSASETAAKTIPITTANPGQPPLQRLAELRRQPPRTQWGGVPVDI